MKFQIEFSFNNCSPFIIKSSVVFKSSFNYLINMNFHIQPILITHNLF